MIAIRKDWIHWWPNEVDCDFKQSLLYCLDIVSFGKMDKFLNFISETETVPAVMESARQLALKKNIFWPVNPESQIHDQNDLRAFLGYDLFASNEVNCLEDDIECEEGHCHMECE